MTNIAKNVVGPSDSIGDSDPFLPKELVFLILTSPLFKRMSCSNRNLFDGTTTSKKLTDNELSAKRSTIFHECYRRLKQVFQKEHNIRFAFLGGSHRTATAVHFFGGYDVKPNKNLQKNSPIQCYNISDNMKINASPSCTIIIPQHQKLDESFIIQCNTYSYLLEKRKTESIQVGFSSLSLNILDDKKHKDLTCDQRFFIDDVFQTESVSNFSFLLSK
jgi:hypothetical protein